MHRLQLLIVALTITATAAWGQQPSPSSTPTTSASPAASSSSGAQSTTQPQSPQTANGTTGTMPQAGAPAATSNKNSISGCLRQGFAYFKVSDAATNTTYQIRGNGAKLGDYENHVVQIQGIPDPKDRQGNEVIYYVDKIQDTGQTCAPAGQTAAGNVPVTGETGNKGVAVNQTNTSNPGAAPGATQPGGVSSNQNAGASTTGVSQAQPTGAPPNSEGAGQTAAAASSNAASAQRTEVGSPQGTPSVGNNRPDYSQDQSQAGASSQSNMSGMSQQNPAAAERKGTPQAGTPVPSTSNPNSTSEQKFQGCLGGEVNNLTLSASGEIYRLQGNTSQAAISWDTRWKSPETS